MNEGVLIQVVLLIVNLALVAWVVMDARRRGANAVLWGIVVLFLGIIGLVIYVVAGRKGSFGGGAAARVSGFSKMNTEREDGQ